MERGEYLAMAAVEDRMWYYRALHAQIRWALRRALGTGPAEILDAGCGTGGLVRRLTPLQPEWRWTGVDNEPLACSLATERTTARIVQASVEALPFPDASFSAVVSSDVIYHVAADDTALMESARVLRPGGAMVLNVPAYRWLWSYHDTATHAVRRYARSEIEAKLRGAGFSEVTTTHRMALLMPLIVLKRKVLPQPANEERGDVQAYPRILDALFRGVMSLEQGWICAGGRWCWGSSIFAVARKPC